MHKSSTLTAPAPPAAGLRAATEVESPQPASLAPEPGQPPFAPAATAALVDLGKALHRLNYRFVTPTPSTIALVNARPGNERARCLTDVFGWNREFNSAVLPTGILDHMQDAGVVVETPGGLRSKVRVSSLGDELYFHSSYPIDSADAVFFGPDTYRFVRQMRLSVPTLASKATRCVDIGCGSGAGAIELARMCPAASVHAVDINHAALAMTRVNAELADANSVVTEYSDMLDNVSGTFDLIVANPPYLVDKEARTYRHGGGNLGAGLSLAVLNAAISRLAPGGSLLLYTASAIVNGADALGAELAARLDRAGFDWHYDEIDPDVLGEELANPPYTDTDRIAAVWLVATKPACHRVYW